MASLSDFNDVPPTQLSDFNRLKPIGSGTNTATNTNMAAHAAVLGNAQDVLKNYTMIASELETGADSPTLDELLKQNQNVDKAVAYDEMQRILRDPAIDVNTKKAYMDGYISMTTDQTDSRSISVLVAQNAVQLPQSDEENDETASTSIYNAMADGMDEVDQYRGWAQSQINLNNNLKDRDFFNLSVDFLETWVPFLEPAAQAKIQSVRGEGVGGVIEAMTLLGQSKDKVRQSLASMPVDQRREVASKLIDIVKAGGGSWTLRRNDLNMINQLNQFLNSDGYSSTDQTVDNIFSLMDVVMPVVGWGTKILKVGKAAKMAAGDLKRAELLDKELTKDVATTLESIPADPREGSNFIVDGVREVIRDKVVETVKAHPNARELTEESMNTLRTRIEEAITPTSVQSTENLTSQVVQITKDFVKQEALGAFKKAKIDELTKNVYEKSNVARMSVRSSVDQTSLSQTFVNSNAAKARNVNKMVEADASNSTANALYGTSRSEAIANDRLPEVANADGSVRTKVRMDESSPAPDGDTVNTIMDNRGRIDLDDAEKVKMRQQVKDAFKEIVGLNPRPEMGTVAAVDTPTGVSFDMVYGPTDGGFQKAQQALYQTLVAFRKYGVKEDELEILSKDLSGKYVPVKGVPAADGNYLVRVKHNYEFTPTDVVDYSLLGNSKYKMFESRTSITDGTAGSILQHIIPASAIINHVIFNSASAASDAASRITKQLVELASGYAKKYNKLSPRQKALVDLYRVEANAKGIPFSTVNLRARGFDDDAIETMKSWKLTTDTMWYLENVDINKTLRSRGWERFIDQVNDTDLIARPKPNKFGASVKAYDPGSNTVRVIEKAELDDLYAKNGNISELKEPVQINDETADFILVQNNESGYIRRIRDDDRTLNYRDGYYPVKYTDPIFIEKEFRRKDGTTYWKAVATAGSHGDAKALLERLRTTDTEGKYNSRADYKRGTQNFDDADWSAAVSGGRSAQRVRGKRLSDSSSITDLNHANVESPEESLISSIRSLSSRTAFRDWLETTKNRWMSQYGDLVEPQKGQIMWPSDVRHISAKSLEPSNTRVQDAKTTWRYVRAMESGYVNLLDDLTKNFFQNVSNTAGKKGWGWIEKGASMASEASPTGFARKKAFRLLLAANPLRQLPVQAMQALPVLLATNPLAIPKISMQMILLDYLANGGDATSFMKTIAKAATGMSPKDAEALAKNWHASGFEAAVEANTLIRDQLGSLVDRTFMQKAGSVARKPLDFMQKIGFNKGEQILMRSVWLSEYDRLLKSGTKIDAASLETLNARVRNLTLNMNRAGELPYNENAFSAAMQFFQAPHKAWSQVLLGHTGLSGKDRLKLGASYILTYGVGGSFLTDMVMGAIGGDPETREMVEGGLFNLSLNNALSTISGETVRTDFSDSLRLLDPNIFNFWTSLMDGTVGEMLSNSASASLVLGQNPRVTNFVKQMMRPFTVSDDKKPEELQLLGVSFLNLFSGTSNILKAKYAMENLQTISAKGKVIDYHVNAVEAFLKASGFSTIDEVHYYASQEEMYKRSGKFKDDITQIVNEVSSRLAAKGISNEEQGWYLDMMAEAQRAFKNDPIYMEEFANQIYFKALAGEDSIYRVLRDMSGYMNEQEFENMVNKSTLTQPAKDTLLQAKKQFGDTNG